MPVQPIFWTATGASEILRRDRRLVMKALHDVKPDKRLGKQLFYQPHTIVTALLNYETRDVVGKSNGKPLTERDRLTAARREQIELEVATRKGELVEVATLEEYICGCYAMLREKMLSLPGQLCMDLGVGYDDPDLEPKIRKGVYETMTEMGTMKGWEQHVSVEEHKAQVAEDKAAAQ